MRNILALVIAAAGSGCASLRLAPSPLDAVLQSGAHEIPAPDSARVWWETAARCLRIDVPWNSTIRYFVGNVVPPEWAPGMTGRRYAGYTHPFAKLIFLKPGYEHSARLVVHEQMHVYAGYGHPRRYFDGKCVDAQ